MLGLVVGVKKYQTALMASIHTQLEQWLDEHNPVTHDELYRFLHSIKGTSATVGLSELSFIAENLLQQLEEAELKRWTTGDLKSFLFDIIKICYEFHLNENVLEEGSAVRPAAACENKPMVLILDDDITFLMFLKEELEKQDWIVIATVSPERAITYVHDMNPDCIIVDLNLPNLSGFQVIEVLRTQIQRQFVPMTVISGMNDRETKLTAYRLGADDFIAKPVDLEELVVRITRQIHRKLELDQVMFVDKLTGAFNRNYLTDVYDRNCAERQKTHHNFSIAILDVDYFKQVNDKHGHLVGDHVLTEFSAFIKQSSRNEDVLIRYGGEEFVVVFPKTRADEAKLLLERQLADFSQQCFEQGATPFCVTFSAGVVEVDKEENRLQDWLKLADQALYTAKEKGRKRIEIAASSNTANLLKKRVKVAIVDDDAIIRTIVADCIIQFFSDTVDPEIRVFRDGEEFIQDSWHIGCESYLIILDGMMPKMDGLEVLKRLRSYRNSERYHVVMLTGRSEEDDIAEALRLGADDYITKPFRMAELGARVERLVESITT